MDVLAAQSATGCHGPRCLSIVVTAVTVSSSLVLRLPEGVPVVEEYYKMRDYWPEESVERFKTVMGK